MKKRKRPVPKKLLIGLWVFAGVALLVAFYFGMMRGWIEKVTPNDAALQKVADTVDQVTDLKALADFPEEAKVGKTPVIADCAYMGNERAAYFNLFTDFSIRNPDFESVRLYISEKSHPYYPSEDLFQTINSEKAYRKDIRKVYGSLDPFYNSFSSTASGKSYSVYFSPLSRERSEIYSFTDDCAIRGVITTESHVICFETCTRVKPKNGAQTKALEALYQAIAAVVQ